MSRSGISERCENELCGLCRGGGVLTRDQAAVGDREGLKIAGAFVTCADRAQAALQQEGHRPIEPYGALLAVGKARDPPPFHQRFPPSSFAPMSPAGPWQTAATILPARQALLEFKRLLEQLFGPPCELSPILGDDRDQAATV